MDENLRAEARRCVNLAVEECEKIGKPAFLDKYRPKNGRSKEYGNNRTYPLVVEGVEYPTKAILAAARVIDRDGKCAEALHSTTGGVAAEQGASRVLYKLGYDIRNYKPAIPDGASDDVPAEKYIHEPEISDDDLDSLLFDRDQEFSRLTLSVRVRDMRALKATLVRSAGACEYCEQAPFRTAGGRPYLEVHHIKGVRNGGDNVLYNLIALCCTDHRMVHFSGEAQEMAKRMTKIASDRTEGLKRKRQAPSRERGSM